MQILFQVPLAYHQRDDVAHEHQPHDKITKHEVTIKLVGNFAASLENRG
ncbi:MAG: hypothetical protein M5U34_22880 [Chloroflexi bacterium]|nr:hypothetical protein [Chloroflexota bacterium]